MCPHTCICISVYLLITSIIYVYIYICTYDLYCECASSEESLNSVTSELKRSAICEVLGVAAAQSIALAATMDGEGLLPCFDVRPF